MKFSKLQDNMIDAQIAGIIDGLKIFYNNGYIQEELDYICDLFEYDEKNVFFNGIRIRKNTVLYKIIVLSNNIYESSEMDALLKQL